MTRSILTAALLVAALAPAAQAQSASFPFIPTLWPADGAFGGAAPGGTLSTSGAAEASKTDPAER